MRKATHSLALAFAASLAVAGVAAAQPIHEPASCSGYLASWANPNNGWIIQNLVLPAAEAQGTTVGAMTSGPVAISVSTSTDVRWRKTKLKGRRIR